jgi:hypothetical protein
LGTPRVLLGEGTWEEVIEVPLKFTYRCWSLCVKESGCVSGSPPSGFVAPSSCGLRLLWWRSRLLSSVGCAWRGAVGSPCLRCLGFVMFAVVAVPARGGEVVVDTFDTLAEAEAAVRVANRIDPDWDYRVSEFVDDTSELYSEYVAMITG